MNSNKIEIKSYSFYRRYTILKKILHYLELKNGEKRANIKRGANKFAFDYMKQNLCKFVALDKIQEYCNQENKKKYGVNLKNPLKSFETLRKNKLPNEWEEIKIGNSKYIKFTTNINKKLDNNNNNNNNNNIINNRLNNDKKINRNTIVMSNQFNITIINKLAPFIEERVKKYHTQFNLPLIAELWEETLHRSFMDIGLNTTWKPDRSHKIGEDMRIIDYNNSRISCKSGQFVNDRQLGKCVKFNGSRSTTFNTLEEKIVHFSNDHEDYYFLLAKEPKFNKTYKLLIFHSNLCKVNKLNWNETSSGKSWSGEGDIFKATIGKAMSAQLWTTIPLSAIEYQYDINCNN